MLLWFFERNYLLHFPGDTVRFKKHDKDVSIIISIFLKTDKIIMKVYSKDEMGSNMQCMVVCHLLSCFLKRTAFEFILRPEKDFYRIRYFFYTNFLPWPGIGYHHLALWIWYRFWVKISFFVICTLYVFIDIYIIKQGRMDRENGERDEGRGWRINNTHTFKENRSLY